MFRAHTTASYRAAYRRPSSAAMRIPGLAPTGSQQKALVVMLTEDLCPVIMTAKKTAHETL